MFELTIKLCDIRNEYLMNCAICPLSSCVGTYSDLFRPVEIDRFRDRTPIGVVIVTSTIVLQNACLVLYINIFGDPLSTADTCPSITLFKFCKYK